VNELSVAKPKKAMLSDLLDVPDEGADEPPPELLDEVPELPLPQAAKRLIAPATPRARQNERAKVCFNLAQPP
jgi:hypothetical protein